MRIGYTSMSNASVPPRRCTGACQNTRPRTTSLPRFARHSRASICHDIAKDVTAERTRSSETLPGGFDESVTRQTPNRIALRPRHQRVDSLNCHQNSLWKLEKMSQTVARWRLGAAAIYAPTNPKRCHGNEG